MTHLDVADAFFEALLAGDGSALDRLFSPYATFFTNFSGVTQHRDHFLTSFAALAGTVRNLRFENVRRVGNKDGFVEQHTLCGTTASGEELAVHGCFVFEVVEGEITHIDEYVDSAQLAPLLAGRS